MYFIKKKKVSKPRKRQTDKGGGVAASGYQSGKGRDIEEQGCLCDVLNQIWLLKFCLWLWKQIDTKSLFFFKVVK